MNRLASKKNILITGAGGAAIPDIVRILKRENLFNIFLCDIKPITGIETIADKFFIVPMANSKDYIPEIKKIIKEAKLDAVVPGVDEELLEFVKLRNEMEFPKIVMPNSDFVRLALNKYELNKTLESKGLVVPKTYHIRDMSKIDAAFLKNKIIAKPICGRGSRGIFYLNSPSEVQSIQPYLLIKQSESIFQECIDGDEYTVSVVVSVSGTLLDVIPKRIINKRGITIEAITERNPYVIEYCKKISELLGVKGAFNVQLILNKENQPYVFEINPRFSTTTVLTSESGFSEIEIALLDVLGEPYDVSVWNENVRLYRKWTNFYEHAK